MKYKIETLKERKTSNGLLLADVTLRDETGAEYTAVIWASNWPNFKDIMMGHVIEGELVTKQNGNYTNVTLYPPKKANSAQGGTSRTALMERAMEKKQGNIEQSMTRKEEAIILSGTARDATLLTIEISRLNSLRGEEMNTEEVKKKWLEMRKWLQDNHEGQPF